MASVSLACFAAVFLDSFAVHVSALYSATAYPSGKASPYAEITGGSAVLDKNNIATGELLGYSVGLAALTNPSQTGLYVLHPLARKEQYHGNHLTISPLSLSFLKGSLVYKRSQCGRFGRGSEMAK
jgi:hypothetical protein